MFCMRVAIIAEEQHLDLVIIDDGGNIKGLDITGCCKSVLSSSIRSYIMNKRIKSLVLGASLVASMAVLGGLGSNNIGYVDSVESSKQH